MPDAVQVAQDCYALTALVPPVKTAAAALRLCVGLVPVARRAAGAAATSAAAAAACGALVLPQLADGRAPAPGSG